MPDLSYNETRVQNDILVASLADITPEITENAINAHPLLSLFAGQLGDAMFGSMGMRGRGKRSASGESIETRVNIGLNDNAKALTSGYDTFDQNVNRTSLMGRSTWKLYGGTAIISGEEMRNNMGGGRIVDLWGHRVDNAVKAVVDLVAAHLDTNSGVTNRVTGVDEIISANDTIQLVDGSLADNAAWNSRGVSAKGTAAASISFAGGSFALTGIQNWRVAYLNAEEGNIRPQAVVTTDLVYTYYEGSLAPEVRFTDVRMGDIGFQALKFKMAPVFHDPYVTSGSSYFLNFDHLWLAVSEGADFTVAPRHPQEFQDVVSALVLFQGELVTSGRKYQNKVTGQTA